MFSQTLPVQSKQERALPNRKGFQVLFHYLTYIEDETNFFHFEQAPHTLVPYLKNTAFLYLMAVASWFLEIVFAFFCKLLPLVLPYCEKHETLVE